MQSIKRWVLVGFSVLWLIGFVIVAPSPLYRWLFTQANDIQLQSPHQLFEGADWTQPHNYAHLARSVRSFAQQSTDTTLYLYFDPDSDLNTSDYRRYFGEYADFWAYPKTVVPISNLDDLAPDTSVIISSEDAPNFTCNLHEATLYLCQS